MRKTVSLTLAVVIICATLFLCFSFPAAAESLYIRKIVSIVYDDSGSMTVGGKWAYANYAMQSFCGMLNSEDQLFITYMSSAENDSYAPEEIDLSSECADPGTTYVVGEIDYYDFCAGKYGHTPEEIVDEL